MPWRGLPGPRLLPPPQALALPGTLGEETAVPRPSPGVLEGAMMLPWNTPVPLQAQAQPGTREEHMGF